MTIIILRLGGYFLDVRHDDVIEGTCVPHEEETVEVDPDYLDYGEPVGEAA